jgi:NitT/TauT family transport system substrate-binding protein
VFSDPNYMYIVLAVVAVGTLLSRGVTFPKVVRERFEGILFVADTIGLAAFTVIGAKVAIVANLDWFWVPICAAITCAGGGVILDVVTAREPRTFRGEPYEEIAIMGGLLLVAILVLAETVGVSEMLVGGAVLVTMIFVFSLRALAVYRGWRVPLLGRT